MVVKVLSHDFKLAGIIDKIKLLRYSECFYDAGHVELVVPFDKNVYKLLKPPVRLLIDELVYTIESFECRDGQIRVKGRGLFYEFKQMYICEPKTLTGKPSSILGTLASEASFDSVNYRIYTINPSGEIQQESLEWCTDYYTIINRLCYENELGFRLLFDGKTNTLGFHIMTVADRATPNASRYTVLSDKRDGYTDFECELDISNYRTCIEFAYRINAIDSYSSYVYNRTGVNESKRTYVENPHIVANTTAELFKFLDTRAKEIFKAHRKIRRFRLTLRGAPKHTVGDLCYIQNRALGEQTYAILTEREIEVSEQGTKERLTLEV